jgi:hypothetical protein
MLASPGGAARLAFLRKASMNPDKIPETAASRRTRLFLEAQARKQALAEGEARGEARGKALGEALGQQSALLVLLRARALEPSREDEARVRACTDTAKLARWIVRAATAGSMREVLGPRSSPPPAGRKAAAGRKAPARKRTARVA